MFGFPFAPSYLNSLPGSSSSTFKPHIASNDKQEDIVKSAVSTSSISRKRRKRATSKAPIIQAESGLNDDDVNEVIPSDDIEVIETLNNSNSMENLTAEVNIEYPVELNTKTELPFPEIRENAAAKAPEEMLPTSLSLANIYHVEYSKTNNLRKLLIVKGDQSLYLSGYALITPLHGHITANGYTIPRHASTKLSSSPWNPAIKLQGKASHLADYQQLQFLLKRQNLDEEFQLRNTLELEHNTEIIMLLIEGISWESLEWLEAAEDFSKYLNCNENVLDSLLVVKVGGAVLCDIHGIQHLGVKYTMFPDCWSTASDVLCHNYQQGLKIEAPICGAKGSGKSTCLRFMINRLLSSNIGGVCVMDCDLGQPEFTVPGMISLHYIASPILSQNFLNLKMKPWLSFYLGEIMTKTNSTLFIQGISQLYNAFILFREKLVEQYLEDYEKCGSNNQFSALEDKSNPNIKFVPLLINCDGNIRYFGEEVLAAIFRTVSISHVLHIVTPKDRSLKPVDGVSATANVIRLEPGHYSLANVTAADLRILRIVSYFLRYDSNLRQKVRSYDSKSDGSVKSANDGISISSGAILDSDGHIATALMSFRPFIFPFSRISFQNLGDDISPRLTLAAFNASIVAISEPTNVESSDSASSETSTAHKVKVTRNGTEFSININGSGILRPCLGLAIVRSIDTSNQLLYAASPVASSEIQIFSHLTLVKGSMTPPTLMMYSKLSVHHLYLTGEGFGEGNAFVKARGNVKRKGHVLSSS